MVPVPRTPVCKGEKKEVFGTDDFPMPEVGAIEEVFLLGGLNARVSSSDSSSGVFVGALGIKIRNHGGGPCW